MRFKRRSKSSQLPEVNLVPMLDVLMVVLTFFIIVSMTLTTQQGVEVQLPSAEPPAENEAPPKVALIKLNTEGQILFNEQPAQKTALPMQVKAFLQENPEGVVVLQPDQKLPYDQVVELLSELKQAGGERVSLAIE
jgi:biopolymer transport protein ExbD